MDTTPLTSQHVLIHITTHGCAVENHEVLCQCASLVAENVLDNGKFVVEIGCLGVHARLWVVRVQSHLHVPFHEPCWESVGNYRENYGSVTRQVVGSSAADADGFAAARRSYVSGYFELRIVMGSTEISGKSLTLYQFGHLQRDE